MAEVKMYKCDICGRMDAKRLTIPDVDEFDHKKLSAYIDLCFDHMAEVPDLVFNTIELTREQKRSIWRMILRTKWKPSHIRLMI